MILRRLRGRLLRLARRRAAAIAVGIALGAPAAWVEWGRGPQTWWAQGLALVAGATGLALLWIGLTGVTPDWVDEGRD